MIERLRRSDAPICASWSKRPRSISHAGQPAIDHVRAALAAGCHVVTANKGPAAFAYAALQRRSGGRWRQFLFEGAVMDGVPIFNLVRETLPAVEIAAAFRGVVNSTTNHILTALEEGEAFDAALARMQAEGIAEADAVARRRRLGRRGEDGGAGQRADGGADRRRTRSSGPAFSERTAPRARQALANGRRLRLVASARRAATAGSSAGRTVELRPTDLLAGLDGKANALVLQTDLLGEIAICQLEGNLTHTAYALLSDLVTIRTPASAARSAGSSNPLIERPFTIVTGTARNPSARSASYAESSSSTFRTVNVCPSRERNSFTLSQLCQCEPV